eukprot:scaffold1634_cov137-Amphora_coffeaeformis.AAC.8
MPICPTKFCLCWMRWACLMSLANTKDRRNFRSPKNQAPPQEVASTRTIKDTGKVRYSKSQT